MKRTVTLVAILWLVTVLRGGPSFTGSLRPADFAGAGLERLTPEQRAQLDRLVEAFATAQAGTARHDAEAAQARARDAEAQARAEHAKAVQLEQEKQKADRGLLARARVLLTPGTQVDYATIETSIVGDFNGWENRTVFTLANGQRWRVIQSDPYFIPKLHNPKVRIMPGALGSFWLEVEGAGMRARVTLVSSPAEP